MRIPLNLYIYAKNIAKKYRFWQKCPGEIYLVTVDACNAKNDIFIAVILDMVILIALLAKNLVIYTHISL